MTESGKMTEMLISEEQIKDIMEKQSENIKDKIETTITNTLVNRLNWNMSESINKLVDEFFKEEIEPHIKQTLVKNKNAIINEMSKGTIDISQLLVSSLVERATKNLTGYNGNDIIKKLFN